MTLTIRTFHLQPVCEVKLCLKKLNAETWQKFKVVITIKLAITNRYFSILTIHRSVLINLEGDVLCK